jgi:hypothetical protein
MNFDTPRRRKQRIGEIVNRKSIGALSICRD